MGQEFRERFNWIDTSFSYDNSFFTPASCDLAPLGTSLSHNPSFLLCPILQSLYMWWSQDSHTSFLITNFQKAGSRNCLELAEFSAIIYWSVQLEGQPRFKVVREIDPSLDGGAVCQAVEEYMNWEILSQPSLENTICHTIFRNGFKLDLSTLCMSSMCAILSAILSGMY